MIKILHAFVIATFLISHTTIAIYSNLLYGRPSVVFPSVLSGCGVPYSNIYATDRVITRYYDLACSRAGYFFQT